jgi:hypothetical protein
MARTRQEIYDSLEAELVANPTLAPLAANVSKTAIWRLLLWVFAYGANIVEVLFDAFIVEVENKGKAAKVGNAQWYQVRILEFQYGDNLAYQNGIYQYVVLDETKKIVSHCSVVSGFDPLVGGVLNIKIAKQDGENLTGLDLDEMAALRSYINKVRFAGTKFKLVSTTGDILKIGFHVYFDPIIPLALLKTNVETVIANYVKNLPFDGIFNITKLIDLVQAVDGVKDCVFINAASKPYSGASYTAITRESNPYGGYYTISAMVGETLSDTLQYTAI